MFKHYSRRSVIRLSAGLAAIPILSRLTQAAESGDKVDESDDLAQQLGYRHDASQAEGHKAGQACQGCAFFQGDANADWGGCIVFGGRQVNAQGWCQSFRPKTG